MSRVRRGFRARRRRKKILAAASGFYGGRSRLFRGAVETVHRAWAYAYRDRRQKKRNFRRLWIARVNAAARDAGVRYGDFMHNLKQAGVELDRKVLADIALNDPQGFARIVSGTAH